MLGNILKSLLRDLALPWVTSALWIGVILAPIVLGGPYFDIFSWFYKIVGAWLAGWLIFLIACRKHGTTSLPDDQVRRTDDSGLSSQGEA